MIDAKAAEKILSGIREQDVTDAVSDLINIPSPPGKERAAADFVFDWFQKHGV